METWVIILIIVFLVIIIAIILIWFFLFKGKTTVIPTNGLKYGDIVSVNMVTPTSFFNGPLIPCGVEFIDIKTCKNNVVVTTSTATEPSNTVKSWTFNSSTKKIGEPIEYGDEVIITSKTGGNLDICGVSNNVANCGDNIGISTGVGHSTIWKIQKLTDSIDTGKFVVKDTNLFIFNKSSNLRLSACGNTNDCSLCTGSSSVNCSLNVTLRTSNSDNIWSISSI